MCLLRCLKIKCNFISLCFSLIKIWTGISCEYHNGFFFVDSTGIFLHKQQHFSMEALSLLANAIVDHISQEFIGHVVFSGVGLVLWGSSLDFQPCAQCHQSSDPHKNMASGVEKTSSSPIQLCSCFIVLGNHVVSLSSVHKMDWMVSLPLLVLGF